MDKLVIKNCPFCGYEAKLYEEEDYYDELGGWYRWFYVECRGCLIRTDGFATKQEAVDTWNTRVNE